MLEGLQAFAGPTEHVLGTLQKDKHTGKFFDAYSTVLANSGLRTCDISPGVSDLQRVFSTAPCTQAPL